ncbi:Holliday junction branch migration protein RuvA [Bartonella bacilliformis]|uniref:Holliday junction branch migration protein RuvA n=1 Tax=Bartonella bacilliformis TaxID=774 RepID=UPI0004474BFF|nr:Holliday junction branch migration protein RuvA [Bartonella bacilliformis]EYS95832.1 Holliday junction ATP-dependent DNA helicase ruvA [Bartonella bacilliformis Peru-18]KEG18221.1 Holliday junction ATP-dependent DNA helicase ruvA [Bartonella bacilliformis CUSCO5]KEG23962.1 Holliday junction ATP-dependent DNA helicase ruvA [Bartonella bacilliformis Ver075]KZM38128.1 Holliday junction ATP-dependent DNA helicase RuvA [Bartonella bacilliformis]
MIGKLTGILDSVFEDHIILDVQGVGYVVFLSNRLLSSLPERGQAVSLFIETHVREDAIRLFGFETKVEQDWFCLLQNVRGVGAKVALAILSTLPPPQLAQAITLSDIAMISRSPGVGKMVSERIINELKNKALPSNAPHQSMPHFVSYSSETSSQAGTQHTGHQHSMDALAALTKLGFERDQATHALQEAIKAFEGETPSSALLIRHSLKLLSSHSK